MWTHGMIACMYIVPSCNIVVTLMAHLKQFWNSCHMQLQCNLEKIKHGWLHVCTMCINYHIEDPFPIHLQL
jgi:hypothetical protein